ncbi:hypothetical protein [Kocuria palustris]|uniref:hypothetical protein n=1 Tax=Kocuria palustris TaxID=71999 RepID=UPI0028D8F761|nr:hypothetical protein [Kocuria palustris]
MVSPSSVVVLDVDDGHVDSGQRVGRGLDDESPVAAEFAGPCPGALALEVMPCASGVVVRQVAERVRVLERLDPQSELLLQIRTVC